MNILIIEDEYPAAERLKALLRRIPIESTIVGILDSVSAALAWLKTNPPPDLILSDIQLSDGLSFEVFEQVEIKSPIIFATAYDEYAIKAFKLNSIDYLVKPIQHEELEAALRKYDTLYRSNIPVQFEQQLSNLVQSLHYSKQEYKERFLVQGKEEWVPVFISEIAYFNSVHEQTYLVRTDGKRFVVEYSLSDLEPNLSPKTFFRANRQYLVQATAIKKVYPYFNGRLLLTLLPQSKDNVLISKAKAGRFKKWFEEGG